MNGMMEPEIRFEGYDGEWRDCNLEQLAPKISSGCSKPSEGLYNLYGSTGIIGTTAKGDYFGDMLLIARVGANAGGLQLVNENCGITDNTLIIKPTHNLTNYIYFFLQHYNLNRLIFGSGQPLITGGMLKKVNIRLGNRSEQSQIVSYFQSLDALIQSATKKIASLRQLKSASLISMFPQAGETKPRVRFKGFKEEWRKEYASELFITYNERNRSDLPVLSACQDIRGMAPRSESGYDISHNKSNEVTYKHVLPGQFVIHLRSFQGGFAHSLVEGITSPAYTVFGLKNIQKHDDYFWKIIFMSKDFIKRLETITYGIRDGRSISFEEFSKMIFTFPSCAEQQNIASFFRRLDILISLQEKRLDKLKQIKSACLDKMFV